MVARLAVIGVGLIVLGVVHFGGNGTVTAWCGATLLAAAAVIGIVQRYRHAPAAQQGRIRR